VGNFEFQEFPVSFPYIYVSEDAVEKVRKLTMVSIESLRAYKSLHDYVTTTTQRWASVENKSGQQRLNLVTFLETVRDNTWRDIKSVLFTQVCPLFKMIKLSYH
jgi:hypothetical protein